MIRHAAYVSGLGQTNAQVAVLTYFFSPEPVKINVPMVILEILPAIIAILAIKIV